MFDPSDHGTLSDTPKKPEALFSRLLLRGVSTDRGRALARKTDLDTQPHRALHRRLMGMHMKEMERQAENRFQMSKDEAFYDNEQWEPDEIAELEDRGQQAIVYNVIATTVNWMIGSERRMRGDHKILPRKKAAAKNAELKTQYMKFISDANHMPMERSLAFQECVKAGIGWMEDGVHDGGDGDPILSRQESWRAMLYDSAATKIDFSDGRFMDRTKWIDLDILESLFPHRRAQLRLAAQGNDALSPMTDSMGDEAMDSREIAMDTAPGFSDTETDYSRPRVRTIEMWFRRPHQAKVLTRGEKAGGEFVGEIYDPMSRGHWNELSSGQAIVSDKTVMRMFVAIMTPNDLLHLQESPYRHNQFPFTPIVCYRRASDGLCYGMIRGLRGLQRDINMRAVKSLHILSTNKTVMDEGAVPDIEKYRAEAARADAVIVKKPGKALDMNVDSALAPAHLSIMDRNIAMVHSVSGVTGENQGQETSSISGRAIIAKQEQGALATMAIFDNHRHSQVIQGQKQLSLIEQFVRDEKSFRITNKRGTAKYVEINRSAEDGEILPESDITATKEDFVVDQQPWSASARKAQVAELLEMIQTIAPGAPQVAMVVVDLVVELMDVPNGEEIVKRIRAITGLSDPDAEGPTPEEQARAKKEQDAEDRAVRMDEATIADREAAARQKDAAAGSAGATAERTKSGTALDNVNAMAAALQLAIQQLSVPAAAPVADAILLEGDFRSRSEKDQTAQAEIEDAVLMEEEAAAAEEQAIVQDAVAEAVAGEGDPAAMPEEAAAGPVPGGIDPALTEGMPI